MQQREFALLVKRMRMAQKAYFNTRESWVLKEAKDLEAQVDRAVAAVMASGGDTPGPPAQATLQWGHHEEG